MPFLKTIKLSYAPRPFGSGSFFQKIQLSAFVRFFFAQTLRYIA